MSRSTNSRKANFVHLFRFRKIIHRFILLFFPFLFFFHYSFFFFFHFGSATFLESIVRFTNGCNSTSLVLLCSVSMRSTRGTALREIHGIFSVRLYGPSCFQRSASPDELYMSTHANTGSCHEIASQLLYIWHIKRTVIVYA